jgi:nucleotide-binding universal stress UspA family protein
MTQRPTPRITAALAFDQALEPVVAHAVQVAQRFGAPLRLVHVLDPWTRSYLAPAVEVASDDLVEAIRDDAVRQATQRLDGVRRRLPKILEVETSVLSGDLAGALAEDARVGASHGLNLLVIGSDAGVPGSQQRLGQSTAVSLLSEVDVPVMIVGAHLPRPADEPWTVLVADDFFETSDVAHDWGFALAEARAGGGVVHVHVETFPKPGKGSALSAEAIRSAAAMTERRLVERAGERAVRLERANGWYTAVATHGAVPDELERTARAWRTNVAVYGRHKVFHRRAMQAGHVPYKAMLSQGMPVIVVPDP